MEIPCPQKLKEVENEEKKENQLSKYDIVLNIDFLMNSNKDGWKLEYLNKEQVSIVKLITKFLLGL